MTRRTLLLLLTLPCGVFAEESEQEIDKTLEESSELHMREELGVNPITTPSIKDLLTQLELFRPIPLALLASANHEASFSNRVQTALHFGSLVADGFLYSLAERPQAVQAVGRALLRQSRALGVGDRLAKRSKSLFELSDKGDWAGMRQELVRTQSDVEDSMMDLRDEELAHMVSLGGWLRGFQVGATSTAESFTPAKAAELMRVEVVDYFLERLSTLHPRLLKTEMISTLVSEIQAIRTHIISVGERTLTASDVEKLRDLANQAEATATSRVDAEGRFVRE